MPNPPSKEELQRRVIAAALDLSFATGTQAFSIPIPGTTPQLYVSLHEGPLGNTLAANDDGLAE